MPRVYLRLTLTHSSGQTEVESLLSRYTGSTPILHRCDGPDNSTGNSTFETTIETASVGQLTDDLLFGKKLAKGLTYRVLDGHR